METIFRALVTACLLIIPALAADTGSLRGIVHDPQHRPLPHAQVSIHGAGSIPDKTVVSDTNGEFQADNLPAGTYTVGVSAPGFLPLKQIVTVTASKRPVLHFQLELSAVSASIEVSGAASKLNAQESTVQ